MNNIFLFDAHALTRDSCTPFVLAFAQSVLLNGFSVTSAMSIILQNSLNLGAHAYVVRLTWENGSVQRETYVYTHPSKKPAGRSIPDQCRGCGCMRSWDVKLNPDSEMEAKLTCTFAGCGQEVTLLFPFKLAPGGKKDNLTRLQTGRGGKWFVIKGEVEKTDKNLN